jgi:hypothetical protein
MWPGVKSDGVAAPDAQPQVADPAPCVGQDPGRVSHAGKR